MAFIGPIPPPYGGVGVMNKSFQEIVTPTWNVLVFNTSSGRLNEDLYKSKGFKNVSHFAKNTFGLIKFLSRNRFKIANVFVTSNIAFLRDSILILILWLCRKKIVVHFHSKKKGEFFLKNFTIRYVALIFKLSNKIIVLSDDHFDYFAKYFDETKMVVIENFVDYGLYDCKIENKNSEFLYVSRLSEKKGIFDLIEAVKIIKDKGLYLKINVLGTAENDEVKNRIEDCINKYGLEENLILHGNVHGDKKYAFFKSGSIFIFPSHFENSPVVIKEAIASNMALVCSNIEANEIILKDKGNTKFFNTNDAKDLAAKIECVLSNPDYMKNLMQHSENCKIYDKKYAEEKLSNIFRSMSKSQ
jgi:glycosyltransferase involved in cell wall biosynthesis